MNSLDTRMVNKEDPYNIAILTKTGPFHLSVLNGLKVLLKGLRRFSHCRTYKIGLGDCWQDAENAMEHIVETEANLIITIGALCSQIARDTIKRNSLNIMQLFGGVTMPAMLGLEPTTKNPHQTSGVSLGFAAYLTAAEVLRKLKPDVKKILLPYSPLVEAGALSNAAMLLKQYFAHQHVEVLTTPLTSIEDGIAVIRDKISGVDTLMTLEGCLINAYDDEIIKLCNEHTVTFFAGGDVSSVKKGAAAGFVPNPSLISKPLFEYVSAIVDHGKKPINLPIKFMKNSGRQVVLNVSAAQRQGMNVPDDIRYFFEFGEVVGGNTPLESSFFQ